MATGSSTVGAISPKSSTGVSRIAACDFEKAAGAGGAFVVHFEVEQFPGGRHANHFDVLAPYVDDGPGFSAAEKVRAQGVGGHLVYDGLRTLDQPFSIARDSRGVQVPPGCTPELPPPL